MKTLQQQIIDKQREYLSYLKRAIQSESIIYNITAGVRTKFDAELSDLQLLAKKAQAEKELETYPEEFVKWILFKQDDFVKTCDGDFKSISTNPIEDTGVYYTLAELYNHWKNIKDK